LVVTENNIRVVVVDDHPVFRQGVIRVLERTPDIEVVAESAGAVKALELLDTLRPDIMICDIRMPGKSGIDVLRRARAFSPNTRSIILSAYDDDEYIMEAVATGASGYVLKTVDIRELPEIVRRVNAGQTVLYPPIGDRLAHLLGNSLPSVNNGPLSTREREIVALAASGMSSKDIAKQLKLSVRTVESHFSRIFVKLAVSSRLEAVAVARSRHLIE
jgi:DNA-binding NarL/FixJ family response regulator